MVRMFKAGDRVRHIRTGRTMVVQKYIRDHNFLTVWQQSDNLVECSWYEPDNGFRKEVFDQRNLVKCSGVPLHLLGNLNLKHLRQSNYDPKNP